MRKALLTMVLASFGMSAIAQGLTNVGANIVIIPSSRWDKAAYTVKTLVFNPGLDYEDLGSIEENTRKDIFNVIVGTPNADANGKQWYEPGYDEATVTQDDNGIDLIWEDQTSPFSSDATYNGLPSFRWTTKDMIADIYFRRPFTTDLLLSGDVYLACGHDDAPAEYYLNGVKIWERTGWEVDHYRYFTDEDTGEVIDSLPVYKNGWDNDEIYKLTDEQKNLIRLGGEENLLAVHVHQNWGGAFADCGLYTKVEGGLEMGYVIPWDGKVLYNSYGGYNYSGNNNPHPLHNWEKLYEAQEGDVYTVHMDGATHETDENGEKTWGSQMHFKSSIDILEDHNYVFKVTLNPSCDYSCVRIKLTDNDNDEIVAAEDQVYLNADEDFEFECPVNGIEIENLKIVFNFAGGEAGSTIKISDMSVFDDSEEKELWVGTHYFNYFYMTNVDYNEEEGTYSTNEIKWPEVEGRTETKAWTLPDFDDEMWETWKMPVGNSGYMPEVQTIWPGGENNNLWVRRTFEMDKVNERLSYALNVCHDDNYETYVNGHLLQKNTGWTNGKSPVQVHIPAKYLNVGKNVIATYIQQNWGGKFYDCGINVEEVNYQECADALKSAIALAEKGYPELTAAMNDTLLGYAAQGKIELETNLDAAEVKEYAKVLTEKINVVLGYAGTVKDMRSTIALCEATKDNGYLTETLADVKVNLDTCATASQVSTMLTKLRVARKKNAAERRTENFVGSEPNVENEFYILNVGDKRFLGGAEAWGCHLATEYDCRTMALVAETQSGEPLPEGFYRIQSFRNNGYTGEGYPLEFVGYNSFLDCATDDAWEFLPVEGKPNVYNIARASREYEEVLQDSEGNDSIVVRRTNIREDGSRYLLGLRDGDNNISVGFNNWNVVDTDMKTPELETNQWMLVTKAERDAILAAATEDNPADASYLISNPGYDQRVDISLWECPAAGGGFVVWQRGGNFVDFVFEGWNNTYYDLSQLVYDIDTGNLLPGVYKLSVQAYYRDGHYTTHLMNYELGNPIENFGRLYAVPSGDLITDAMEFDEVEIHSYSDGINMVPGMGRLNDFTLNVTDEEGNVSQFKGNGQYRATDACWSAAEEYFQNGLYWNSLTFTVPEGNLGVRIGVRKAEGEYKPGDWLVCDNWRLTYYGNEANADAISSATEATATTGDGYIYNLSGQKLQKALKGVNIVNGRKYVVK